MEIDMPRVFDYLVAARGRLMEWVGELLAERPAVYSQTFPFGMGSIRATLLHMAAAEWAYVERLAGRDFLLADSPFTAERLPEFEELVRKWNEQAAQTADSIRTLGPVERPVEFISRTGPAPILARATAGEIVLHMTFHEVHHRAQVMAMLRQCGVRAENLDYSILAFTRTPLT
jgi:uncharacterized damage-inducible protein DinB